MNTTNEQSEKNELLRIKRFLLDNGFRNLPAYLFDITAQLINKNLKQANLVLENAYSEIAATDITHDALRVRLGYYIDKNYDNTAKTVLQNYDYSIGEYYDGIKNFIDQMSIVYSVFYTER